MDIGKLRERFEPQVPKLLKHLLEVKLTRGGATMCVGKAPAIEPLFPETFGQRALQFEKGAKQKGSALRVGVVLSGGQAPGGHTVIAALFDGLQQYSKESQLFGFLGGPEGLVTGTSIELTAESIQPYRNSGGFDLIGSGRTKIESEEQLKATLETVQKLDLDGIVIIGGDDSNTNAAVLAEFLIDEGCPVVGVPKTIDGDLKNGEIEASFGFDTATKVYAELIGNLGRDALSAKKYFHCVKLMGRSASHIALECALKTHPNITLIGEEIQERGMTLEGVVEEVARIITQRAEGGKPYGVMLIPEGLIEFIPEMRELIDDLNRILAEGKEISSLNIACRATLKMLPENIQEQLVMDRDPHGNVQVSHIKTEELLIHLVKQVLAKGVPFSPVTHFFGYEGRCSFPSNFDTNYCYALGLAAVVLIHGGYTGYMSVISNLAAPPSEWEAKGVPITSLLSIERRKGKEKPVIQKALVDLKGAPFQEFSRLRAAWEEEDAYLFPGPIQYFGPGAVTEGITRTLQLEQQKAALV